MVKGGAAEYVFFPPACVGAAAGVVAVDVVAAGVVEAAFVAAGVAADNVGCPESTGVAGVEVAAFLLSPPHAARSRVAPRAQVISSRMFVCLLKHDSKAVQGAPAIRRFDGS
jgi:hypothetical protein